MELKFEIYRDGSLVRTESLSQSSIKIGKLPSSLLRLDDPDVARMHAVIEQSADGNVHIHDLGTPQSTFVNGNKISRQTLRSGDEISLGSTRIIIKFGADAEASASAVEVNLDAASGGGAFDVLDEETKVGGDSASALDSLFSTPEPQNEAPSPFAGLSAGSGALGGFGSSAFPSSAPSSSPLGGLSAFPSAAPSANPEPQADAQADGWYDDDGNWHDGMGGYYDPDGNYHDQYGGYYDPDGNYFDGKGGYYDAEGNYKSLEAEKVVSDTEIFSENYLEKDYDSSGKGTLEVAFLWNDHVIAVNHYHKPKPLTIGEEKTNTFSLKHDAIPSPSFPFLQPAGNAVQINFTQGMQGLIYIDDKRYSIDEAIRAGAAKQGGFGQGSYTVTLSPRTRVRLDIGENTILAHYAQVPLGLPAGGLNLDAGLFGYLAVSLILHMSFMFLAFYIPPAADGFELDGFDTSNRFVTQLVKPEEEVKEEEEPDFLKDKKKDKDKGAAGKEKAKKAGGSEGKAGKKDSKETGKKMAIQGNRKASEVEIARNTEIANNSGALSVLNNNSLAANFGTAANTVGADAITAMGDGAGSRAGEAYGFGAFGAAGAGRGGGGALGSSFGGGEFGAGAGGRAGGGDGSYGKNAGKIAERTTRIPQVVPGSPNVRGSLSKDIIRRVIRRHRREVKYCYEQELIKNKALSGRIIISFTISGSGRVAAAAPASNTLGNAKVANCIVGKVRRWVFPEPKGGGIVVVKYPFVFSSK